MTKKEVAQIKRDIRIAFDAWDAWTGNRPGDEQETFRAEVKAAQKRVNTFVKEMLIRTEEPCE